MFADQIPATLFPYLLVFVRIGAALMFMPALGENAIPARMRLHFAVVFAAVATPVVAARLPVAPDHAFSIVELIVAEVVIGAFIGAVARILVTAMHVAGMVIAFQSSLAAALIFDPNQGGQGSVIGTFLTMVAVLLIFVTDMHHLLLRALVDSYVVFPAGAWLPVADSAHAMARVVGDTFRVGLQIAAPAVVAGFVLYFGAGLLNRLMPQMMVFFVVLPVQITLGFGVVLLSLAAIFSWFLGFFDDNIFRLFGGS